jgi:hypothetical protein
LNRAGRFDRLADGAERGGWPADAFALMDREARVVTFHGVESGAVVEV